MSASCPWLPAGPDRNFTWRVPAIARTMSASQCSATSVPGGLPENINFAIKSGIIRSFLEANQIEYETAQSSGKLEPADVGELAAKSVAFLECYK